MFEYTSAFLKPFVWAQKAYEYTLGLAQPNKIDVSLEDLTTSLESLVPTSNVEVKTAENWNLFTRQQSASVGGLYQTIDQAEEYYKNLYTLLNNRVLEGESRTQNLENTLKVLTTSSKTVATTMINVKGGDTAYVENNTEYYTEFDPLEAVPTEGAFKLKDTGVFSSIRSLGGFAGEVVLERSLGPILHNGDIQSITDGNRHTFWMGSYFVPAMVKTTQADVPWLPYEYRHGLAFMLTYYLDRPTVATEVFIDPITTEPLDLLAITWTPSNISDTLINGSFTYSSSGWSLANNAVWLANGGIDGTSCVYVTSSSGQVSQTFSIPGVYLTSSATGLTAPGRRVQLTYQMRGMGDCTAGARITWLDSSGNILDYSQKTDYPNGFYVTHRLVDFVPLTAASGVIELGIFDSASAPATAFFDGARFEVGERSYTVEKTITRPTTINLPEITLSGRFSFVLAQRNPRREIIGKEAIEIVTDSIVDSRVVDKSLQDTAQAVNDQLTSAGPGRSVFAYRAGMRELDLRYREHLPRGLLVTLPINSRREIREVWSIANLGTSSGTLNFVVYPFADDIKQQITIKPFLVGELGVLGNHSTIDGQILKIFTFEEQASGWVSTNEVTFVTEPKHVIDEFDGTDPTNKIVLKHAPHVRKVRIQDLNKWVDTYNIYPAVFDPNLETVYGIDDETKKKTIRKKFLSTTPANFYTLNYNELISREGYLPIRITIHTDNWIAYPDTFGRPDITKIRQVKGEVLSETTLVQSITDTKQSAVGFDSWLNTAVLNDVKEWGPKLYTAATGRVIISAKQTEYQIFLRTNANTKLNQLLLRFQRSGSGRDLFRNALQDVYNKLKAGNQLQLELGTVETEVAAVERETAYATKYKPIVEGKRGSFIKLYFYNPTTGDYQLIPRHKVSLRNSKAGLIVVNSAAPSGFSAVVADYLYYSDDVIEDHFGSVISTITENSTGSSDLTSQFKVAGRSLPITRNMTDYIQGITPKLRFPNFDRLSKDYYPVIEYYVNSDSEIIFAREFFRYGDLPARIVVEYDTLNIAPRLGVQVSRASSPSATPTIHNISLRIRESSPTYLREVE